MIISNRYYLLLLIMAVLRRSQSVKYFDSFMTVMPCHETQIYR